jgi:hypothetical protein
MTSSLLLSHSPLYWLGLLMLVPILMVGFCLFCTLAQKKVDSFSARSSEHENTYSDESA